MKHKMNKISGYYEGPDGVFYDARHDKIFVLEFEGARVWRRNVGDVGKFYRYVDESGRSDKTALVGMDSAITRLGDL